MARQIFTVNATQVVTSENHPEGVKSVIDGYPKDFDSRAYGANEQNPNGSEEIALIVAQADYADRVKTLTLANTASRVMWTVTIERADGALIAKKTVGAFPDMTPVNPAPEPEPEPEVEGEEEPGEGE